ncbi:trypsin beta-like [Anopheles marshallii]|uniref:trypsin beta-like n=1 Tax=Anopheles marshallii TaxID=1521116 RepID=UPI00237BBDA3|nr:trypsin beta-like [Anopheles marshallii]
MKAFILLSLFVAGALAGVEESLWLSKQVRIDAGSRAEYNGRIVGGSTVPIGQFPYQLSLRQNGNHICGASVISGNWALSAAHCTFPMPSANSITFRGGSASRTAGGVIFQAAQIINHPQYNSNNLNNDVCVIRITTSFVGANIATIRLVASGTNFAAGTNSVVSGWGLTVPGGALPVNLHAVNIPVVAQATCSSQWGAGRITAAMVCAGVQGRDSCNGDSGGPLVTGGAQFGVVSWGAVQCGGPLPGVYANIGNAGIRSFINQHTGPQMNEMTLRAGSSNRLFGGTIFSIAQIINHPRFSEYTIEYDVSLLQSTTDIMGQFIAPVALPPATSGFGPGTGANATGWGLQSVPNSLPVLLQIVEVPLITMEQCRSSWPTEWITEDMLCAGQPGRDTCGGDSGGPLVINGYQMGIASWGVSDCSGNLPSVYASIAHPTIRSFIQEHSNV